MMVDFSLFEALCDELEVEYIRIFPPDQVDCI